MLGAHGQSVDLTYYLRVAGDAVMTLLVFTESYRHATAHSSHENEIEHPP